MYRPADACRGSNRTYSLQHISGISPQLFGCSARPVHWLVSKRSFSSKFLSRRKQHCIVRNFPNRWGPLSFRNCGGISYSMIQRSRNIAATFVGIFLAVVIGLITLGCLWVIKDKTDVHHLYSALNPECSWPWNPVAPLLRITVSYIDILPVQRFARKI